MIIGFIADPDSDRNQMGTGKTLYMTMRAYRQYRKGARILANYGLRFPHEKVNSDMLMRLVKEDRQLHNCVLVLTEVHVLLESRRSSSDRNIAMSYLILQTRKRDVRVFYDSQDVMQVEKRLRENTDYFVFCKKLSEHWFSLRVYTRRGRKIAAFAMNGKKYYPLYDTTETTVDFTA